MSWSVEHVSDRASLPASVVECAEAGEGAPDITLTQLARLQGAYEAAGVRFGYDGTVWAKRAANDPER